MGLDVQQAKSDRKAGPAGETKLGTGSAWELSQSAQDGHCQSSLAKDFRESADCMIPRVEVSKDIYGMPLSREGT